MTQYILINKDEIKHISNFSIQSIIEDLNSIKGNNLAVQEVNFWMLEILNAYDEKEPKDPQLLNLAENVQKWISKQDIEDTDICIINTLQILKRKRNLTLDEKLKASDLFQKTTKEEIKYACCLLLDSNDEANKLLDSMDSELKNRLLSYPISVFNNSAKRGYR